MRPLAFMSQAHNGVWICLTNQRFDLLLGSVYGCHACGRNVRIQTSVKQLEL